MSKVVAKASDALAEFLEPGEHVLAGAKGHLEGGIMRVGLSAGLDVGVGGALGALGAYKFASKDSDLAKELSAGAVLVATDTRFVVMSATKVGANPKDVVLWMDRGAIAGVTAGSKRVMLNKLMTLTVSTAGEEPDLTFEFPKVANKDAKALMEVLS